MQKLNKKSLSKFAALTALGVISAVLVTSKAQASEFLFQWDDSEPVLTGNTYQDGNLIQSVAVGNETYGNGYGLWGGVLAESINVRANILEGNGAISDTWVISGQRGSSSINIPFSSDVDAAPLQPLSEPTLTLVETGDWQTVAQFSTTSGDHYTFQFRSDAEQSVPDAGSSLTLMSIAFAGVVGMAKRFRKSSV